MKYTVHSIENKLNKTEILASLIKGFPTITTTTTTTTKQNVDPARRYTTYTRV
jgi:hypothetical protein